MLSLNREYAVRHLAVAALMLGMSGWFLFDGKVKYPAQDDAFFEERHTKRDVAIRRQFQFSGLTLLAALVIAGRVGLEARRKFGFGKDDVAEIDFSQWEKKRIAHAVLKNGRRVALDAWHFTGVREFIAELGYEVPADAAKSEEA